MTRDKAIAMLRGGLGEAMQKAACQYSIPICWITSRDGKPHILENGTTFLLDAGAGPFMVTARHVYSGYMAAREEHADLVCLVGGMPFTLESRLIAQDEVYDVATFRMEAREIEVLRLYGKVPLTGSQTTWPPAPPQIERGMFFVGFPGDGRTIRPYKGGGVVEVDWHGYTALAVASGVSATDITLVYDPEYAADIGPRTPPEWALGGCSGAPMLTFVDNNGVFSWRLGGVIYEAAETIIKASRADCLNPDGSINRAPNPMAYLRR